MICRSKGYAVNVPLKDGITNLQYTDLFRSVLGKVMEIYRPDCIVLQSGREHVMLCLHHRRYNA